MPVSSSEMRTETPLTRIRFHSFSPPVYTETMKTIMKTQTFEYAIQSGLILKRQRNETERSETKFDDTHDVKHDDAWSWHKKLIKHTFPPTWDKTTTSNRFEYLRDCAEDKIKDDHVADADTLDMQIQNVKLKRQV